MEGRAKIQGERVEWLDVGKEEDRIDRQDRLVLEKSLEQVCSSSYMTLSYF